MATSAAPPVVVADRRASRAPELLLILLIIGALGAGAYVLLPRFAPAGTASATASPRPLQTFRPASTQRPTAKPVAPAPEDTFGTTQTYGIGEPITISTNGAPWAKLTVSQVSQKAKYAGEFSDDTPAAGNTYIQAFVTYEGLADGVDYGPFDWQVFVGGVAVENFASILNGPTPELISGTLPKGRKAEGWVVYEVPKVGQVVMSYGGIYSGEAPVFEVVIRGG